MSQYFTVAEIARTVRKSPASIVRRILAGEIPAIRIGRTYRVKKSDLASFLDRSQVNPIGQSRGFESSVDMQKHAAAERLCQRFGI